MPYISPHFIEKLEAAIDIVQVIGDFVELKKAGSVYKGLSPFTEEKTPSFVVSPTKQIFKDFSSDKGGGAVHFLMLHKGWTYPEAIEYLAEKYKEPIQYDEQADTATYIARREKKAELAPIVEATIAKYHAAFKALPPDHPAKLEIYQKRQYTDEAVNNWEIGYAPETGLYKILSERGLTGPAAEIGLIRQDRDRYKGRVIYPIRDARGQAVGLAGRDLSGIKAAAKWINPDDSPLYNKSQILYGFVEARESIFRGRQAILVEGYNDVISFHESGLKNTVSSSGTALSREQMDILRKVCDMVVLCMDPDRAGIDAMQKMIPALLNRQFRVLILQLPGVDPDDFVRLYAESIAKYGLPVMMSEKDAVEDGFGWLMRRKLKTDDEIDRARHVKILCEIVALIDDEAMVDIYSLWLAKESKVTKAKILKWVKDAQSIPEKPAPQKEELERYVLPRQVTTPIDELIGSIEKYQLFQSNDRVYVMANDEPPFFFKSVTNFSIEVVQHMQDEKFPYKLIRAKNIFGKEVIFDVPSGDINTPQQFDKTMTDKGNFLYTGGRNELQLLRAYMYDQMGTGRKIDVLGHQPEGFWCWNSKARLDEGGEVIEMCGNGILKVNSISYYIPSGNKMYADNRYKYDAQKRFDVFQSPVSFEAYTAKMLEVHGDHAITGILWTLASIFQDIQVSENGNFPIMYLYGPASSGKDQMMECCQSFFGLPQTAINLEGDVSTVKAQVREFAQFNNGMGHLSEYKRGNPKLDGMVKGLWDRRGYKRGNIESFVGTESIPVTSSVGMTGNDYPDNEALITRLMVEDMNRTTFTEVEVKRYEELRDMTAQGISSLTDDILIHRKLYKKQYKQKYRMYRQGLSERIPEAKSRMLSNMSVLGATYHILRDEIIFPFDHNRITEHFERVIRAQMRKLASASITTRWWDCYLASMRGAVADQLRVERDFKIDGDTLYFNFTNAFNKIQRQWYQQHHEPAPGKTQLTDALRKDKSFIDDYTSMRIGLTNTSAMGINLAAINIKDELKNAMEWQMNEGTLFSGSPATPEKTQTDERDELPF